MARFKQNQIKQPKKPFTYVLNKLFKIVIYLLLVSSIAYLIYIIEDSKLLNPEISWKINGELKTQVYEYDEFIKPLISNKYVLNLSQIKNKLKEHPWISSVEVERIFWNKVKIELVMHDIAMRFGSEGFISSKGELFKPNLTIYSEILSEGNKYSQNTLLKPKLAIYLDKPVGLASELEVKKFYSDFKSYQSILEPVKIILFERASIDELTLSNNVKVILGHQKQIHRLELFIKSFEALKNNKPNRAGGIFDMRYPDGFAFSYWP